MNRLMGPDSATCPQPLGTWPSLSQRGSRFWNAWVMRRSGRMNVPIKREAVVETADPGALIRGIVSDCAQGVDAGEIAGAFHLALADLIVSGCERARAEMAVSTVVLSGGVFMNAMLLELASAALLDAHFEVLVPRLLPCNDGGLSLGQAYVAACALEEELCA